MRTITVKNRTLQFDDDSNLSATEAAIKAMDFINEVLFRNWEARNAQLLYSVINDRDITVEEMP